MPLLTDRTQKAPLWLPLLLAALIVLADQALKAWAVSALTLDAVPIPFIPGLIEWKLLYNTGAAWGMLEGGAQVLAVGRLLVGVGILAYLLARPQGRFLSVVLSMIAAGAIGNAIDGLRFGKVTDMFHSPALSAVTGLINGSTFPIFNIADSAVVGGTLLLLAWSVLADRKTARARAAQATPPASSTQVPPSESDRGT